MVYAGLDHKTKKIVEAALEKAKALKSANGDKLKVKRAEKMKIPTFEGAYNVSELKKDGENITFHISHSKLGAGSIAHVNMSKNVAKIQVKSFSIEKGKISENEHDFKVKLAA